jgi:hypothetical protein
MTSINFHQNRIKNLFKKNAADNRSIFILISQCQEFYKIDYYAAFGLANIIRPAAV